MSQSDEIGPATDLRPLVEALRRKLSHMDDRLAEMEEKAERREEYIDERIDSALTQSEAANLTPEARDLRVATALTNKARSNRGAAKMDYKEVLAVFDHAIGTGTAYKIMERLDDRDGFNFESGSKGKRVTVDLNNVDGTFTPEQRNDGTTPPKDND